MQFFLQTVFHDLRQFFSVQFMRLFITDIRQLFIAVRNDRRAFIRPYRRHTFYHICDPVRIGDHDLFCLVAAKIGKLLQHLLRCPQIQRRLVIRIGKMLSCHNDPAVYLIFRIEKMHVACRCHRLMKLLSQLHDFFVDLHNIFHGIDLRQFFGLYHKPVIAKRLNLKIIIETDNSGNLRIRSAIKQGAVKFPCFTGAAKQKSFPVLHKQTLGNPRPSGEIMQMGLRNKAVQIHTPHIVLG